MKISASTMALSAAHLKLEKQEIKESLTILQRQPQDSLNLDSVDLLSPAGDVSSYGAALQTGSTETEALNRTDSDCEITEKDKLKIALIESFIEHLTGKKFKIRVPTLHLQDTEHNNTAPQKAEAVTKGWGFIYRSDELYYEKEAISFNAKGLVKTTDGQEIEINLTFNMSREFLQQNSISIIGGDAAKIDPLVINFNGQAPVLTEEKFAFDLDADGATEQISFLQNNSGFLSLDLNNNEKIDDGRELFGPKSGDGFADLAAYDHDDNGWIDENDTVFNKLRIWIKDEQGHDQLLALGEVGIGAIYLGSVNTLFSLNDLQNNNLGQIQRTGLFLREDKSAGTIQHIDLAI